MWQAFIAHKSVVNKWINQFLEGKEDVFTCNKMYEVTEIDGNEMYFTQKEKERNFKFLRRDE